MVPKIREAEQTIRNQSQQLTNQSQIVNRNSIELTNLNLQMVTYQADMADQAAKIRHLEGNAANHILQIDSQRRRLEQQSNRIAENERKIREKDGEISTLRTRMDDIMTRLGTLERHSTVSPMKNNHYWSFPNFRGDWSSAYENGTYYTQRFLTVAGYKIEVSLEPTPDNSISIFAFSDFVVYCLHFRDFEPAKLKLN